MYVLRGQILFFLAYSIAGQNLSTAYSGNFTNCVPQPEGLCKDLGGRASDHYITQSHLPPDMLDDLALLQIKSILLEFNTGESVTPCYEFMLHLLCLLAEPPCNHNSSFSLMLCPETCQSYNNLISSHVCDEYLANIRSHSNANIQAFVSIYDNFNCSDPSTFLVNDTSDYEKRNNLTACTNLFSPTTQESILAPLSCIPLVGSICPSLFPGRFNGSLFLPGRENTENEVFAFLAEVSLDIEKKCSEWLDLAACVYFHPPCIEDGKMFLACKDSCERLVHIGKIECQIEDLVRTKNITGLIADFFKLITEFNCSDPEGGVNYPITTSCYSYNYLSEVTSDEQTSFSQDIIIAGTVGGVLIVLLAMLVAVLYVRTRIRHKVRKSTSAFSKQMEDGDEDNKIRQLNPYTKEPIQNSEDLMQLPQNLTEDFLIPRHVININAMVGQGEFGMVYKATLNGWKGAYMETVAVKTLKVFTYAKQRRLIEESLVMAKFDHLNVMKLIGVSPYKRVSFYIVMPFMIHGSLLSYLRKNRAILNILTNDEPALVNDACKRLWSMCLQISKGMEYLASLHFVHRDLAARNCMIDDNFVIKVSDFGLTEDVYSRNYFRQISRERVTDIDENDSDDDDEDCVKLPVKWMALESLSDGIFSEKTDVWSFGVTCWEVFSLGIMPYIELSPRSVVRYLERGERLEKPDNEACSDEIYSIMKECWNATTEERPTFSELVRKIAVSLEDMATYLKLIKASPTNYC